jgi:hypothetical protein
MATKKSNKNLKAGNPTTSSLHVGNITVSIKEDVICWTGPMAINADGSPFAYHPNDKGLDYLANAGSPGKWWGIACDPSGNPYIQGPTDPAPGYYVSTTSLTDKKRKSSDPQKYVNSSVVPYIVIPPDLKKIGVKLGDLALVKFNSNVCPAIIADIGPAGKVGEGSIALAERLGIKPSPKKGGTSNGVSFTIFMGTATGWPRDAAEIASTVIDLASKKLGG